MEKKMTTDEMQELIAEMKEEILQLKDQLAKTVKEEAKELTGTSDVRTMFEDGFAKLSDALRPLAEQANQKFGEPAKEMVERVEEKISVHPFTAMTVALGVGVVVGKLLDIASRPTYTGRN